MCVHGGLAVRGLSCYETLIDRTEPNLIDRTTGAAIAVLMCSEKPTGRVIYLDTSALDKRSETVQLAGYWWLWSSRAR